MNRSERAKIFYCYILNICYWCCALIVFGFLFASYFLRYALPVTFWIPAIIGILFLFYCVFAIAITCNLNPTTDFWKPKKQENELDESIIVEEPPEEN